MAKQGKPNKAVESAHDSDHGHAEPELVALVRGFAEIVAAHGLSELIVDTKETTLTLRRGTPVQMMAAPQISAPHFAPAHHIGHAAPAPALAPVAAAAPVVEDKAHVVTSPFVGTFYRKPNPDSASYVSLGDKVEKGAALCIVEAMKLMNEIEADVAGTVVGILVEDGSSVEYGQPLFRIAP
jgi:acetyl-CoA carboxylase biotin carboxyl carrier protein